MSGRKPTQSTRDRKRVKTQSDASDLLGLSPQRLQDMRKHAPWWREELKNEDGWDVVGIALAQYGYHQESVDTAAAEQELVRRKQIAATTEAEQIAEIKILERVKRERIEAQEEGSLIRVETVRSLLAEALGMLRRSMDDVPYVFSQQVPPEFQALVFTIDEAFAKSVAELAPLQRIVMKVCEDYQRWLDRIPDEVFEGLEVPDVAE